MFQKSYPPIENAELQYNYSHNQNNNNSNINQGNFNEDFQANNVQNNKNNYENLIDSEENQDIVNNEEEEFIKFKKNYNNFYRGYTPDENSKKNYAHSKKILQAYENIKNDLNLMEKEKEKLIVE